MNDKISVIIPIYNVSDFINKCVDSIIHQTYINLEILLIEDCSTDDSLRKIEQWEKIDSRIRIIQQKKNSGLSASRNLGLIESTGEYICFIDGDDYINPDMISKMYAYAWQNDLDVVTCDYLYVYSDGRKIKKKLPKEDKCIYYGQEGFQECLQYPSNIDVVAWNKLYKRKIFLENNIFFPIGRIHEDLFTTYKVLYCTDRVGHISEPLYYYVQRNNSIMHATNQSRNKDVLACYDEFNEFADNEGLSGIGVEFYKYRLLMIYLSKLVDANFEDVRKDLLWVRGELEKMQFLNNHFKFRFTKKLLTNPKAYIFAKKIVTSLRKNF